MRGTVLFVTTTKSAFQIVKITVPAANALMDISGSLAVSILISFVSGCMGRYRYHQYWNKRALKVINDCHQCWFVENSSKKY